VLRREAFLTAALQLLYQMSFILRRTRGTKLGQGIKVATLDENTFLVARIDPDDKKGSKRKRKVKESNMFIEEIVLKKAAKGGLDCQIVRAIGARAENITEEKLTGDLLKYHWIEWAKSHPHPSEAIA
jgi:hypothetical protein